MFCPKCGKEIADTAAFCPGCGASVNAQAAPAAPVYQQQAPVYQQAPVATAPAQPSPFSLAFKSFLNVVKGMFSKNVVKTVGDQAKNTGLEWVFGLILAVLSFAFAMPVNIVQTLGQLSESKVDEYPFFAMFGISIVVSLIVLGTVIVGLWLLTKLVAKKNVPWTCVLNVVSAATIPLSLCYIANMLLGLIWWALPVFISVVALFMTVILLYVGFQKLEKPVVSPFYPFAIFTAALVVITVLFSILLYKGVINDWAGSKYGFAAIIALFAQAFR